MKALKDRYEIAEAINIDMLPVLTIDVTECADGYEGCYKGSDVRVKFQTRNHGEQWTEGTLWYEGGEFKIVGHGFGIKDRFCYEDMMEMAKTANAPMLEEGREVVVVMHSKAGRYFTATKMKVSEVNPRCITRAKLL